MPRDPNLQSSQQQQQQQQPRQQQQQQQQETPWRSKETNKKKRVKVFLLNLSNVTPVIHPFFPIVTSPLFKGISCQGEI